MPTPKYADRAKPRQELEAIVKKSVAAAPECQNLSPGMIRLIILQQLAVIRCDPSARQEQDALELRLFGKEFIDTANCQGLLDAQLDAEVAEIEQEKCAAFARGISKDIAEKHARERISASLLRYHLNHE